MGNTSLLSKECTPDNSFTLETKQALPEPLEPQPSSSVTPKMERNQELDSHPDKERPFLDHAEPWLELLLVDKELKSQCLRLPTHGTRLRQRGRTGQSLEV